MKVRLAFAAVLLTASVLSTGVVDAQNNDGSSRKNDSHKSPVRCLLTVESASWSKASDTRIHLRLTNTSDKPVAINVLPVLDLNVKTSKAWMYDYWAPADLREDAPAPIDDDVKNGHTITPKDQLIRLEPNSESEFILHASNLRWDKKISSSWPSLSLFKCVPAGEYTLSVELGENLRSNAVAIVVRSE